ncbi:MAG: methyltransferase domain-containing protein [Verrucomicrobia bacterium]|nr:methyltransferase domain-containing protein [Verrucomicrobiota bacterium]MCH8510590.1 methyltransferase domain-containing protein [Kiritimatiellia bacterium]
MTQTLSPPENDVQSYYGEVLQSSADLKTNACTCDLDAASPAVKAALAEIHPEILNRFYGCGSPLPPLLEGCTVLDLGCGTGRDVFVAAKLAGPAGRVIGVDMTENQIAVARKHAESQAKRFGFPSPTTEFLLGPIEDLAALDIADNSVDVVMSNCVINLSARKDEVFREIFRVLKSGGELIFSDVFADRRIPMELRRDPVLLGECLSGALYLEDFRRLLAELNCPDYRVVSRASLDIGDAAIEAKIGFVNFESLTVRAFKLDSLEDACEDYGQIATYLGTLPDAPHAFSLDTQHRFPTGKPIPVCGNTAAMLSETRYTPHFRVHGTRGRHFGLFPCVHPQPAPACPTAGSCC